MARDVRPVKDLLGGNLRPSDPRRFLIEAMVGAMRADGHVDPREAKAMEQLIADHDLFGGLGAAAAQTLVDLSVDAIKFAGGAIGRVPAIARALPARIHRLAAFGMASEIAMADRQVVAGEVDFLEALRIALRIAPAEADNIMRSAKTGYLTAYLDERFLRIQTNVTSAAEVFALRALTRGLATDGHRVKVRDFFLAIPDLARSTDELDAELYRAFRRPRDPGMEVYSELMRVAATLPDPVDRYWIVVYTLVAETPAAIASWRSISFIGAMQAAFQIVDTDMELAVIDALTFSASIARPG